MTLPAFEMLQPASLSEALEVLSDDPTASPICGGTNLIVDVRAGRLRPERLIDLSGLAELRGITWSDGEVRVGAATTIAALLESPQIQQRIPGLPECCRTFANALIRNRATIGGNLVNAAPCADTAPALLVLDARVELTSAAGVRHLPLEEFLVGAFETKRRRNELLTAVSFPIPPACSRGGFRKMGLRKISCMAKVDVAVYLEPDDNGICTEVRIALGAASASAMRVREAEAALRGERLTGEAIDAAARAAEAFAQPRAGSEYKRQVVYGLTRRLLAAIAQGEGQA